jgi:hypothetical protein
MAEVDSSSTNANMQTADDSAPNISHESESNSSTNDATQPNTNTDESSNSSQSNQSENSKTDNQQQQKQQQSPQQQQQSQIQQQKSSQDDTKPDQQSSVQSEATSAPFSQSTSISQAKPLTDTSMTASFNNALHLLSQNSLVELMEGLETLLVYTRNLILFPDEKKYRKIKISNIHYQERLGHLGGALNCMQCIGYIPVGDYLRLDEKRMSQPTTADQLKQFEDLVQSRLAVVRAQWQALPNRLGHQHAFESVSCAGSYSAIGKRHNMEDDEIMCDRFGGEPKQGYFGLYDGHVS